MTPNINVVREFIKTLPSYAFVNRIGVTNCRPIAGQQTYSQHSWSNALDIHFTAGVGIPATGAALAAGAAMRAAILAEFGEHIYEMLWQVPGHWEHIHVSTWPKGWLTPPCAGGTQRIKYEDGTVQNAPFPLTIEGDDDMASPAQKTLVDLAFALFPDEVTGDPAVWLEMPEDDPQWWQYFNPAVVKGAKALYKRSKDGLVLPTPSTGTTDATARSMAQKALDALVRGAAALKP